MDSENNHQQLKLKTFSTLNSLKEQKYLADDTEDDGVDEADPRHPHQTQEEQVRITIQLKVRGFGVEDGAHKLAFLCAEACQVT